MNPILQVFYSILSGLSLSLALPNEFYDFGNPFIVFFSIIPFYLAIRNSKNYLYSFINGFIFTCTTHLASSFWLAYFKDFAALTLGASAFGTGLIGAFLALFMYLPFSDLKNKNELNKYCLHVKFFDSLTFRILYFASLYTLYEWVKSCGFLGYPWGTLSCAIFKFPEFMQIASITGTYGITFLIMLVNCLLAELFLFFETNHRHNVQGRSNLIIISRLTAVLYVISLTFGFITYHKKLNPQKTLTTIVVQQNSDPWKEVSDDPSILVSENLAEEQIQKLKEEGKSAQLIVWSEGTLRRKFPNSYNHYKKSPEEKPLVTFVKENKVPLLTGGSYVKSYDKGIYFNAAVIFDKDGNYRGIYGKNHLVPFAEAIPGMEIPAVKNFMKKVIGISAGWTPGDQYTLFDIPCSYAENYKLPAYKEINLLQPYEEQKKQEEKQPVVKIATPICFDDSFPDIMRPLFLGGTELFINLTDDSWSLTNSAEYQHFVVASYRAIEYRTTMIRSCNAGYSVVLNPQGKVIADLPLFEKTAMSYDVPVYEHKITTYARFGNWLPWLLFILFLAFAVYSALTFQKYDYIQPEVALWKKNLQKKREILLKDNSKDKKTRKSSNSKKDKKSKKSDEEKLKEKKNSKKSDKKKKDSKKKK